MCLIIKVLIRSCREKQNNCKTNIILFPVVKLRVARLEILSLDLGNIFFQSTVNKLIIAVVSYTFIKERFSSPSAAAFLTFHNSSIKTLLRLS